MHIMLTEKRLLVHTIGQAEVGGFSTMWHNGVARYRQGSQVSGLYPSAQQRMANDDTCLEIPP